MDHCLCTWLSKDQQFRRIFDIHVYIYTLFFEFFFFFPHFVFVCVCVCVCKFQIFKRNLTNLLHTHISFVLLCYTIFKFQQKRNLILSSFIEPVNKGLKLPNTTLLEWMLSQVINSIQIRNGMAYFFPNLKLLSKEPATYIMC